MTAIGNISTVPITGLGNTTSNRDKSPELFPATTNTEQPTDRVQLSDAAKQVIAQQTQAQSSKQSASNNVPQEDVASKVADGKRRVQGLVGIDGISEIVDGFGNIDTAKLAKLEAQQV